MRIYEVFCFAKEEWPPRRVGLFVARSEYEAKGEAANAVKEEGVQFAGMIWNGPPVQVVAVEATASPTPKKTNET